MSNEVQSIIPCRFYEGNYDRMNSAVPSRAGNFVICKDTGEKYIDLPNDSTSPEEEISRIGLGPAIDITINGKTKRIPLTEYTMTLLNGLGFNTDGTLKSVKQYINDNSATVSASSTLPKAPGTNASLGSENNKFARGDHVHPVQTSISGNAGTTTKLATARTIALSGDVSGSTTFDGSADVTITTTIADDSHNHTISNIDDLQTTLDGKAIKSHASTATTYGISTASKYGHSMASSTTPKANGTAAVGSETAKFARGDHVHPL